MFHHFYQLNATDCGPACLQMVCNYYGKYFSLELLREKCNTGRNGTSIESLVNCANSIGLSSMPAKITLEVLKEQVTLPTVLLWNRTHFVVLYKIKQNLYYIADPASGKYKLNESDFKSKWLESEWSTDGILINIEQWNKSNNWSTTEAKKENFWKILKLYRLDLKLILQTLFAVVMILGLQSILPFLTKIIIDEGIADKKINLVSLIIICQGLILGLKLVVQIVKERSLFILGTKINFSILANYWNQLAVKPINYFTKYRNGDILQKLGDSHRIESFLTSSFISTAISLLSLIVYSVLLAKYNLWFFLISIVSLSAYFIWILLFLNIRKLNDYKRFNLSAGENNSTITLVNGMQELRINNAVHIYLNKWMALQSKLYNLLFSNLTISQLQQSGSFFILELKNTVLLILGANEVINGHITVGAFVSVQYIITQLDSPVEQIIAFVQNTQDSKLAYERMAEEYPKERSNATTHQSIATKPDNFGTNRIIRIRLVNVCFKYNDCDDFLITNLNLDANSGDIIGIMGPSGIGKSSFLKIIMKLLPPSSGKIYVTTESEGEQSHESIANITENEWWAKCTLASPESYLFADTILNNIVFDEKNYDENRLKYACTKAQILDFITSLPMGFSTVIGVDGIGLSQGQVQRIILARAFYKTSNILLLDEATSFLDKKTEDAILSNIKNDSKQQIVFIVTHHVEGLKYANKIIEINH